MPCFCFLTFLLLAIQNIGFSTAGPITLRLTVFSGDGSSGLSQVLSDQILPPGSFVQISSILASNGLSFTNGYVRVERVSGTAPNYAYGVINDQANSDGSFIPPILENALAGKNRLTLPVVVESGAFSTELVITNWSSTKKRLNFSYITDAIQTTSQTARFSVDINASTQLIWPDLVQRLREKMQSGQVVRPVETIRADIARLAHAPALSGRQRQAYCRA